MYTVRKFLAVAIGFLLWAATLGGADAAKKITTVDFRIGYSSATYLAKSNGFFEKEGLDVNLQRIKSGKYNAIMLGAGESHINLVGAKDLLGLRKNNKMVKWVYSVANRMTMDFVMNKKTAERLSLSRDLPIMDRYKALKGLKIGITRRGAVTDLYTRFYLRKAGLDPDRDATIIPTGGGANLLAALKTGQIDGFMLSPPRPATAVDAGFGKIIIKSTSGDVPEFKNFAYTMLAAKEGWLKENGDVTRAYIRAVRKGAEFLHDNTDKALVILKRDWFPKAKVKVLESTLTDYLPTLPRDGKINQVAMDNMMKVLYNGGAFKKVADKLPDTREGFLWTNEYNY